VSGQCRGSVGAVSGALDVVHHRMASSSVGVSECRSVGVSVERSVEECRSVGVSECRSVRVSECRVGLTQVGDSFKQ
jgi:hypothetical protein